MDEIQKLYEEYQGLGYGQGKALMKMSMANYDQAAMDQMVSLYSKKKSQDSGASPSSSETGSTVSPSDTALPQQVESGDSDFPLSQEGINSLAEESQFQPYNVPAFSFPGAESSGPQFDPENIRIPQGNPGVAINVLPVMNGEDDGQFMGLFRTLHIHNSQLWGLSKAEELGVSDAMQGKYGYLPIALQYEEYIEDLAKESVLSDETRRLVDSGMELEDALKESKTFMDKVDSLYEFKPSKSRFKFAKEARKKSFEKDRINEMVDKFEARKESLDLDYTKYLSNSLVESITNPDVVERDDEGNFTGSAQAKLKMFESALKKQYDLRIDLTGDSRIGDRPFFKTKVRFIGDTPTLSFEGSLLGDAMDRGGLTAANAFLWLGSKILGDPSQPGGKVLGDWFEKAQLDNEEAMRDMPGAMDTYQRDVLASIQNGEYANAIQQMFLMTAEGWPYLIPALSSEYTGPYGAAAATALYGIFAEASAIRNDYSFDTFIKDGKEFTYYEAIDAIQGGDEDKEVSIQDLLNVFEIEENNLGRAGYLAAVGIGDFAISATSIKTLRGMYMKAQYKEAKNFLWGYASGLGISLSENALADFSAYVGRESVRGDVTGEDLDPDVILRDGLNFALSKLGTTGLLYTLGSANRRVRSTPVSRRRNVEVIPLNSKEINDLSRKILETQRKAARPNIDPRVKVETLALLHGLNQKRGILYRQNESYLDFLRKKNSPAFEDAINDLTQLDRLKYSFANTNDLDLRAMYKQAAQEHLKSLTNIYNENKVDFQASLSKGQGIYEREMARQVVGVSLQEALNANLQGLQTRPMPKNPVPVGPDTPEIKARWEADGERRKANDWLLANSKDLEASALNKGRFEEIIRTEKWATLTAENPDNKTMGDLENTRANKAAVEWLENEGLAYHKILGRYDGKGEFSFLVENMSPAQAKRFASEFNQHSVATPDGLVKPDGSVNAYASDWNIGDVKAGLNNASVIKLDDGTVVSFAKDLSGDYVDGSGSTITEAQFWGSGPKPDVDVDDAPPVPAQYKDKPWKHRAHQLKNAVNRIYNWALKSDGGLNQRAVEEVYRSSERLMSVDIAIARDAMGDISQMVTVSKKSSDPDVAMRDVLDYIEGKTPINSDKFKYMTDNERAVLENMRLRIDNQSESIITYLESLPPLPSPEANQARLELIEKIRKNKGAYLTTSYEMFTDGGARLEQLLLPRDQMSPDIRKAFDEAVQYTATQIDNPVMAEREVRKYLMDLQGVKSSGNFNALGAIDNGLLKAKNNNIPEPYARLLGRIEDPVYAYMATVQKVNSYLSNVRWQTEMALVLQETGLGRIGESFEGTEGDRGLYVPFAQDTEAWEPLRHVYVPKEVKTALSNIDPLGSWRQIIDAAGLGDSQVARTTAAAMQLFTSASSFSKISATVFSPTATSRNLLSGNMLQMQNGHSWLTDPSGAMKAVSLAWPTTRAGKRASWREERNKLIGFGIAGDGANSTELMRTMDDLLGRDYEKVLREENGLRKAAQKLYAFGDDFYKISGFYIEKSRLMQAGMLAEDAEIMAAERIRRAYPTYSYISKGAQTLRKLPTHASFVSFPYEMVRTTKESFKIMAEDVQAGRTDIALKRAGGMLVSLLMAEGLSDYSKDVMGLDDSDDEAIRYMLPEWQQNSLLYYAGQGEDGMPYFTDLSYIFPQEVVMEPLRILFKGDPKSATFMDDVQSAVDTALEPYASTDLFYGGISEVMNNEDSNGQQIIRTREGQSHWDAIAEDPAKAEELLVHLFNFVAPGALRGNAVEFLRSAEQVPEDHPLFEIQRRFNKHYPRETRYKVYDAVSALYGVLGFRFSTFPYEASSESQFYDQMKFTAKVEQDFFRQIADGNVVPQEEITKSAQQFIAEFERSESIIKQIILTGRKLGVDEDLIAASITNTGVTKAVAGAYINDESVLIKPISVERTINRAIRQTSSIRYNDDEREQMAENIRRSVELWNTQIEKYNDSIEE